MDSWNFLQTRLTGDCALACSLFDKVCTLSSWTFSLACRPLYLIHRNILALMTSPWHLQPANIAVMPSRGFGLQWDDSLVTLLLLWHQRWGSILLWSRNWWLIDSPYPRIMQIPLICCSFDLICFHPFVQRQFTPLTPIQVEYCNWVAPIQWE